MSVADDRRTCIFDLLLDYSDSTIDFEEFLCRRGATLYHTTAHSKRFRLSTYASRHHSFFFQFKQLAVLCLRRSFLFEPLKCCDSPSGRRLRTATPSAYSDAICSTATGRSEKHPHENFGDKP